MCVGVCFPENLIYTCVSESMFACICVCVFVYGCLFVCFCLVMRVCLPHIPIDLIPSRLGAKLTNIHANIDTEVRSCWS